MVITKQNHASLALTYKRVLLYLLGTLKPDSFFFQCFLMETCLLFETQIVQHGRGLSGH